MSKFKCPICDFTCNDIESMHLHIEKTHQDQVPQDWSVSRYYYSWRTGKTHGNCVICKQETLWNDATNKYHRFCNNPKCKETYTKEFRKRMIGKYGKVSLLNDPEQQKKMLQNRKISGKYEFSDGGKVSYTGSYELHFLRMLDLMFNFSSADIMSPSPHTYHYLHDGKERFYIPDFFIPSLGLEIEIKDGGTNPNMHHKIQDVDKTKEKLKDNVMTSQKEFHYIKITDKNYTVWFEFLNEMKRRSKEGENHFKPVFIIGG